MASNFSCPISYDGKTVLAVIVPMLKRNGMHYEVNIQGLPRFVVAWSPLGRYDIVNGAGLKLPDNLILAVSDVLESSKN